MNYKNTAGLFIGIASVFMVAGCSADETATPGQQQTTTKTGIEITSDAQMNAGITIGGTQATENPREKLDAMATQQKDYPLPTQVAVEDPFQATTQGLTATEQAALDAALKLGDPSYCDKMSTDENKTLCRTALEDKNTLDAAVTNVDPAICERMSTADLREACKIQIDVIIKEQQAKQQFTSEMEKSKEITASKDYTRCSKELKDPSVIDSCELTIIMNLALESNDVTLCEKITSQEAEQRCKEDFARMSTPPPGN